MDLLIPRLPTSQQSKLLREVAALITKATGVRPPLMRGNAANALLVKLPQWLLREGLLAGASQHGGGRVGAFPVGTLLRYVVMLLAFLASAGVFLQIAHVRGQALVYEQQHLLMDKRLPLAAVAPRHPLPTALAAQRTFDLAALSHHKASVDKFVALRYAAIKRRPINAYHRIQAHNAFETIDWAASNQSLGFLWLLISCDRIDLDVKMDGDRVVLFHSPETPSIARILKALDPNLTTLEEALDWIGVVMALYPKHFLMINVESHSVPADRIVAAFDAASLTHLMYSHGSKHKAMPTVEQLVDAGTNLMVFVDNLHQKEANLRVHLTVDYYNEGNYKCKLGPGGIGAVACSAASQRARMDHGDRALVPASAFLEMNVFGNEPILGLPAGRRAQQALRPSELANPFNLPYNGRTAAGINKDFVSLSTDVLGTLTANMRVAGQNSTHGLRAEFEQIQGYYDRASSAGIAEVATDLARKLLESAPLTRFIVAQAVEAAATTSNARRFYEKRYATLGYGYRLPFLPLRLFVDLCQISEK